ncbi:MAG TPA: fructose-bisphosphatase class II, partial [Chloroflexota bacterium]|nr:fructose-bisphosphatase class II [Chloroflexota bacterium]
LRGVQYTGHGARTHSLMMRSRSGTMRWIEAVHRWQRLMDTEASTSDPRIWRDRARAGKS